MADVPGNLNPTFQTKNAGPSRKAPRLFVTCAVAAVLLCGAGYAWHRYRTSPLGQLPEIDLSRAFPGVKAAIEQERGAVRAHPRSGKAWGRLGLVLRAHEFGPQSTACLSMAERLDPREFLWPYLQGVSLAVTDANAAMASFRRATALRPREALPRLRLGELSLAEGKTDEAAAEFRAVLASDPEDARALLGLSRCALAAGDFTEARRLAAESVALAPGQRACRELLEQVCSRLHDEAAADEQRQALAEMPAGETKWDDPYVAQVFEFRRDPAWLVRTAQSLVAQGNGADAIRLLEEIVAQDDADPQWKVALARTLIAARDLRRASTVLEDGVARHPDAVELQIELGALHFSEQNWRQAARAFRTACRLKPDSSQAQYNLGQALKRADDAEGAIDSFREAIRLAPGMAAAHANLGELLTKSGHRDEGLEHLRLAVSLDPTDAAARRMLDAVKQP